LTIALSLSCSQPSYDLEQIRARAEAFDREITLSWYETDNYGHPSRLTRIYEKYDDLFTDPGLIHFLGEGIDRETDSRERRRLEYLQGYLIEEFIGRAATGLDDLVLDVQSQEVLELKDQELAFRDVYGELYNSSDRRWRREVHEAQNEVIRDKINPLLTERLDIQRDICRQFGYADYAEFQDHIHSADFDRLADLCEELLYQSELIYGQLLEETARRTLNLPPHEIHVYDRPRLFRGQSFDEHFPGDRMVTLVQDVLADLGIVLDQQPNIDLDVENRPEKEPRPACYIITVPEDIRVLVKPMGGADDYKSLFHEMGHAQHYAHVEVPEYEFRILGEDGVTETYAFLFENLFMDENFLIDKMRLPAEAAASYIRQCLLADLSSLRYYCALFLFERQLHSGVDDPPRVYRDLWERARMTRMSLMDASGDYLMANEDFYSVGYLEAWLLEAQLWEVLRDRYGPQWFSDPRTGEFLQRLWALGSEKTVSELSRDLGYERLDAAALRRRMENLYQVSEQIVSQAS
jgi:oligoendopeptidase F